MRENLEQESSGHKVINPLSLLSSINKEMDSNSRKRKIESEEFDDEDAGSVKSSGVKSCSSSDGNGMEECKFSYGLKHNFLKSLGIRPPIERWVFVCNFRCDKPELKEVLEVAGHVVTCAMFARNGKMAKVMYSHPLEAVQAVSMLNGQTFYGQKLHVSMMNCPSDTLIMPKGLTSVGPGLGIHGRPLRDVAKEYSKYLKHKVSLIDNSIFVDADDVKDHQTIKEEYISDEEGNDMNAKRQANRRLKLISVEDLPDDDAMSSESKNKKAKRDSEVSDQESEDGKSDKKNNVPSEEPKAITTVTSQKDSKKEIAQSKQNPNPSPKLDMPLPTPVNSTGPQNYRPPMPHPSGPPKVTPPVRTGCPPPPIIGPLSQTGPARPFGPQIRPTCPPVPIGPAPRPVGHPRPIAPQSGPKGPQQGPIRPLQGPQQRPMGPQLRPLGPQSGPVRPLVRPMGPVIRPPRPFPSQVPSAPFMPPRPMGNPNLGHQLRMDPNMPAQQQITLQFRNLPPTTTFPLLCEKVAQCGQVLSLQLTTPGCAVAIFAHKAYADRCFQIFNGKFIDGHVIEVRFAS